MILFRRFSFYLAIAGICLALVLMQKLTTPDPTPIHIFEPAVNPYEQTVAASGIIEAMDKNIEIGVPQSGLVKNVFVKVSDQVEAGQPLFQLDDRELHATLLVQNANVEVFRAQAKRLADQLKRLESVEDPRAISQEEISTRRHDVAVAQAQSQAAEAQLTHTILLMERLMICAPKKGTILQSSIRKGEFISTGTASPIMILGDIQHLQVRAQIDEQNALSIASQSPATAFPKNKPDLEIGLRFDRIEPYVIPKRSLTGASDERVDTRVLHVIYTFDTLPSFPLYVGQQVDVFIKQPDSENVVDDAQETTGEVS